MASYYAWSNFPVERNEWGQPTKIIKVGDSVSASDLGVSKEEFEELIAVGAVSEEEYPDIPASVSPAEYQRDQAAQQASMDDLQAQIDQQKEAYKQASQAPEPENTTTAQSSSSGTKSGGSSNK
jgi:hypothetical protein